MKKKLLLLLLLSNHLLGQPIIKNLVFEGAGVRGIAYAGAIKTLENKNPWIVSKKLAELQQEPLPQC